jgi:hypothetical protein
VQVDGLHLASVFVFELRHRRAHTTDLQGRLTRLMAAMHFIAWFMTRAKL